MQIVHTWSENVYLTLSLSRGLIEIARYMVVWRNKSIRVRSHAAIRCVSTEHHSAAGSSEPCGVSGRCRCRQRVSVCSLVVGATGLGRLGQQRWPTAAGTDPGDPAPIPTQLPNPGPDPAPDPGSTDPDPAPTQPPIQAPIPTQPRSGPDPDPDPDPDP